MDKNKKLLIIIGIITLLLVALFIVYFIKNKTEESDQNTKKNVQDNISAPATNTEELIEKVDAIEVKSITADEIIFDDNIELEENQKVAVWIYSEPKFLGYFDIVVENGLKKIVGLKAAIAKITIEDGEHNIAITTESGKTLGYVDVCVENSSTLKEKNSDEKNKNEIEEENEEENTEDKSEEKTTKKITTTENIKYSTIKQNEINMKKGQTLVVQTGSNGSKEITYEVTYDSNKKEISRKKVSEKIIKEAINEIIKVGTSDFNLNTDYITNIGTGFMCLEEDILIDSDNFKSCDDTKNPKTFSSITINETEYLIEVDNITISSVIKISQGTATYQGALYYFDGRSGTGEKENLTVEKCSKYGITCGSW